MIFVDQKVNPIDDGEFAYYNKYGDVESVELSMCDRVADIKLAGYEEAGIYVQDIPNLIKALQAAYDFWEKNNGKA